jgi:dolichyl-phosphate beta-glucosyltransferase
MSSRAYDGYQAWKTEPLSMTPTYSVIIPAYNEAIRILPTIGAIATHMSSLGQPWELIVADDGSKDNTVALLKDLCLANMVVLVAERNGGKGSAVRRGVGAARGRYMLIADADQSTPIEQFSTLLRKITDQGFDISIGSRAANGAEVSSKGAVRHILSFGLHLMVKVLFGLGIRDTQCGFKLFTSESARDLFARQTIDGFSFDLEVLYLAQRGGYRVAEVPVEWIDAPGSTVDAAKVAMRFLVDLVGIRLNDLRGRYSHPRPLPIPAASAVSPV